MIESFSLQCLAYALIQAGHNLGAVLTVAAAGATLFLTLQEDSPSRLLRVALWLTLAGWALQVATGFTFGLASLHFYGRAAQLSEVALYALGVKIVCALAATDLCCVGLIKAKAERPVSPVLVAAVLLLAFVALMAAAALRWYS
jgi:hypothetical protein